MPASDRIPVTPEVLKWARESAGLDTARAATLIGVSEAIVERWETGQLLPTIKQLRKAATKYHRPLAVLLLPKPPHDFDAMRDFRSIEPLAGPAWSPRLHVEYKRASSQREVMMELAEIAPFSVPSPAEFPFMSPDDDPDEAGERLRTALGLDDLGTGWAHPEGALKACIVAAEHLGVLVIQTQRVRSAEMQGFSIAEWPFPVVALNGGDAARRRLFTLLHELSHLALNAGGLCDLHEVEESISREEDNLEHFCNQVAASALMPARLFLAAPLVSTAVADHGWTLEELRELSLRFGPSSEAVLLHLVRHRRATWKLYWERKNELEALYAEAGERERRRRQENPGGPSWYVVHARDLGHGYVTSVLDAFHSRAISSLDVSDYLDVRFDKLEKLEQVVFR
jgi:Zn-dependent peptidase ImmA (M78 family)/transcriptional regulator with XRE-family HTH domain